MRAPYSVAAIGLVENRVAVMNAFAELNYYVTPNVRLSATGEAPTTHVGLVSPASTEFVALITGAAPAPVEDPAAFAALMAAMNKSIVERPVSAYQQFHALAADLGLQVIVVQEGGELEPPLPEPGD